MTTTTRYPTVSIILHWAMFLLIAAVYAAIQLREFFPKGSGVREGLKTWHFMLGLSVLALVLVRIVVRLLTSPPSIMPTPPKWQTLASRATHVALYALMIGMPLAGWMILSAKGLPVPFYGAELPALIAPDKALGDWIKEIHETAGTVGYWLIGIHAAAALAHHYVWKDDTLRRMLGSRS